MPFAREDAHTYIEIALDYMHAGLFDDAIALLNAAPQSDPLVGYFLGYRHLQKGDEAAAGLAFEHAAAQSPDYVFPHRLESVLALQSGSSRNPEDA